MGQGQEHKPRTDTQVEIQERGEIFFFYRPKVNREEAHSVDDVQRLYIVLRPESDEKSMQEKQYSDSGKKKSDSGSQEVNIEEQELFRLIVMGRKRLPDASKKSQPYWGFVDLVTTNADDVKTALKETEYETSTRGHRHLSAARAVGEGIYRIVGHNKDKGKKAHSHLIYKLELPPEGEKDEPQESLNIEREGSFIIQIKNPKRQEEEKSSSSSSGGGSKRKAVFPAHLQGQLGHVKFAPADPPDFLNYEGCELLLISASDDIEDELGLELQSEQEQNDASRCSSDLLSTFGETASADALLKGTWV